MSASQPEITLAIAPGCPHCPNLMQLLGEMVKQGELASMQVINIASANEFAEQHGIRSVPWMQIGPFILTGVHNKSEIRQWLERAGTETGIRDYINEQLTSGELATVTSMVQTSPDALRQFLPLMTDDKTNINVRLGIGAILEDLAGNTILLRLQDGLIDLLKHKQARVRGDAAHFLSLLQNPDVIPELKTLSNDTDPEVREIAQESVEELEGL